MKLVTIFILVVLILSIFIGGYYYDNKDRDLNINGLEIKASQFSDIFNFVNEGAFIICNMEDDECFLLNKRKIE